MNSEQTIPSFNKVDELAPRAGRIHSPPANGPLADARIKLYGIELISSSSATGASGFRLLHDQEKNLKTVGDFTVAAGECVPFSFPMASRS